MLYSTVLSALYLPLVLMLVCLIFRGVSFEIPREGVAHEASVGPRVHRRIGGRDVFSGRGARRVPRRHPVDRRPLLRRRLRLVHAVQHVHGARARRTYALLGCCWLIAKTEGDLQRRFYRIVWPLTVLQLATIAVVSVWTPFQDQGIAMRWFDSPLFYRLLPVPVLVRCLRVDHAALDSIEARDAAVRDGARVRAAWVFVGLVVSISPHEVLPGVSLWDAAAPRSSQLFTIVGAAVILPVIVAYTTLGYWVFRGKVRHGEHHYH